MPNIFLTVVIGAGIGTAIVEIIIKLFLGHWLKQKYYTFKISKANRRKCSDILLEILSIENIDKWHKADISIKAFNLVDRLISIDEKEYSDTLARYITSRFMLVQLMTLEVLRGQSKDHTINIMEQNKKSNELHEELLNIAKKLKKK